MRQSTWIVFALAVLAGCSFFPVDLKDLSREPPIRQRYLFDVSLVAAAPSMVDPESLPEPVVVAVVVPVLLPVVLPVLLIEQARAASPFNGRPFIYRTSAAEHSADYYHEFLTSPAEQITQITSRWLRTTQQFAHVIESDSALLANQLLSIELIDLRGDYRDVGSPLAVVGLRMVLTQMGGDVHSAAILFEKDYLAEVAMPEASPSHLVAAWSAGIQLVMTELSSDLGRLPERP
ncbi:MAG: hypothetical protein ACJAUC_001541 [Planctomycetota bacterium]|jgi:hypothetical protein